IYRIRGEGAKVEEVVAARFERGRHLFLQREARVITANRNSHGWVLAPYSLKIRAARQSRPGGLERPAGLTGGPSRRARRRSVQAVSTSGARIHMGAVYSP